MDDRDIAAIRATGRDPDAVRAQLEILRGAPPRARLDRPCTVGDGIERIPKTRYAELEDRAWRSSRRGRLMGFVPASGAATRLFASLLALYARGDDVVLDGLTAGNDAERALLGISRLALWGPLAARMRELGHDPVASLSEGRYRPVLEALFGPGGLGVSETPKGLLPFHRYPDRVRTAFEEHLVELSVVARDSDGRVRAHFTVSAEHREAFEAQLEAAREWIDSGVRLDVRFSVQDPATDTVAVDANGQLVRDHDGHPVFRPGGHGALLGNLAATAGDIVLVKNIDNVVTDAIRREVLAWRTRLTGRLLVAEDVVRRALARFEADDSGAIDVAHEFVTATLGLPVPDFDSRAERSAWLRDRLDRPLRVCGMVPNEGQPGGGPFWADDGTGSVTRQIVEGAQVDRSDPAQVRILETATHFNPVEMVLSLRDARGLPCDLQQFVDPGAWIVTEKTLDGRPARVLERPGLWNGSMARWNTIFVEIPALVFNPVKTLADLLGPRHLG